MKLLWVMFDGGGNVPPQLQVAAALRDRGVQIHVLGHRGLRERVEAQGFSFDEFTEGRHFEPTAQRSLPAMMGGITRVTMERGYGRSAVAVAQRDRVDAVVMDMILAAAVDVVVTAGIPTVVFVHCFYRAVQDFVAGPLGVLLRLRGVAPVDPQRTDVLQIVSARADLDPTRGSPPVHHVGVVWQGTPVAAVPAVIPRILVSLSTCAYAGQRRMLQHILDAIAPLPVESTVTVGPSIDASRLRVPPNAAMHAWLDHDEVLATASLVVGHGGHSTVMRALSFGVPQVLLPANPMTDQKNVGAAIQRVGAGLLLPKHAGVQRIRGAIERVLGDPQFHRSAERLGAEIRGCDGAQLAADAVENYLRGSADSGAADQAAPSRRPEPTTPDRR